MYGSMFAECFEKTTVGLIARPSRGRSEGIDLCVGFFFSGMHEALAAVANAAIYAAEHGLKEEFQEEITNGMHLEMVQRGSVILSFPYVVRDRK